MSFGVYRYSVSIVCNLRCLELYSKLADIKYNKCIPLNIGEILGGEGRDGG